MKGAVRLPAILFTVSAVPSGGKPPRTQRGGPAGIAGTDLPYHGAVWRHGGITQRTATRTGRAAAFATRSEPAYSSGLRAATALAAQKNSRRVRAASAGRSRAVRAAHDVDRSGPSQSSSGSPPAHNPGSDADDSRHEKKLAARRSLSFLSTSARNRGCASSARRRPSACCWCSASLRHGDSPRRLVLTLRRSRLRRESSQLIAQRLDLRGEGTLRCLQLALTLAVRSLDLGQGAVRRDLHDGPRSGFVTRVDDV